MPDLDKFAGYMKGTTFDTTPGPFGYPLSWETYNTDPLTVLLRHGDSAGWIPVEWCEPLAKRLEELIAAAPNQDLGGHVGLWHQKTQTFIDGLRLAASLGENVDFSTTPHEPTNESEGR
jgi:hypothetical protein